MAYEDEDDLTVGERVRLGIGFSDRVYIVRNSFGDATAVKAIDPFSNREGAVDLKIAVPHEGHSSILDVAKAAYLQMRRLPQNYVAVIELDGTISHGYRSGTAGLKSDGNGASASMVIGNAAIVAAIVGDKRSPKAGSYGSGNKDDYRGPEQYKYGERGAEKEEEQGEADRKERGKEKEGRKPAERAAKRNTSPKGRKNPPDGPEPADALLATDAHIYISV